MIKRISCFLLLFIIIIGISCKKNNDQNNNYWKVTANRLLIRDAPDITGKVIGFVNKDEKLLIIQKTGKEYTSPEKVNGQWFKVKTSNNIIGYAFSGFLTEVYSINKKPFNIIGEWHRYFDPPNQSYYFYENNKCKVETIHDYDKPVITDLCTYEYDGTSIIKINYNDGHHHIFEVINIDWRTTLKDQDDDFIFDEKNLHYPIIDEK